MSNISDCHNVRINELSWYSLEFLWVGSFYCFLFFFFQWKLHAAMCCKNTQFESTAG